ncbi:MAG: hypothetical protein O9264_13080 [Leptospira sp.]|nr:hypothetical protein [Leptospira sp.]
MLSIFFDFAYLGEDTFKIIRHSMMDLDLIDEFERVHETRLKNVTERWEDLNKEHEGIDFVNDLEAGIYEGKLDSMMNFDFYRSLLLRKNDYMLIIPNKNESLFQNNDDTYSLPGWLNEESYILWFSGHWLDNSSFFVVLPKIGDMILYFQFYVLPKLVLLESGFPEDREVKLSGDKEDFFNELTDLITSKSNPMHIIAKINDWIKNRYKNGRIKKNKLILIQSMQEYLSIRFEDVPIDVISKKYKIEKEEEKWVPKDWNLIKYLLEMDGINSINDLRIGMQLKLTGKENLDIF